MTDDARLMRRVLWRIMPVVTLIYLIAIIDRSNIGFAKLQMLHQIGLTEAGYGLGASLFFVGYLLFEVPSTLAVHRFGARLWLARIMATWGACTILLAFTSSGTMFYVLRFLLGVAEAGAYPGLIFYMTLWFPQSYRVRVLGLLTLGSAIGNMFSALLGGALLDLDGIGGLAGWQWVFIATGVPAVIMTAVTLLALPREPLTATFLSAADRTRLAAAVSRDRPTTPVRHGSAWRLLWDRQVWLYAVLYTLILTSLYGVIYWLPTVVRGFGVSGTQNGLLIALPWAITALILLWLPARLQRHESVLVTTAIIALVGVLAFASSTLLSVTWMRYAALAIGTPCVSLLLPCFWSMPYRVFSGVQAATAIAAISMVGNLGGVASQNLMPWVAGAVGTPVAAMLVPAVCLAAIGVAAAGMRLRRGATLPAGEMGRSI
jgi:MFS family permease